MSHDQGVTMDIERWRARLAELAVERAVPGASLAVLVDGEVHTAVTGVLNVETGVEVTPDTVFQIGSTTKPMTATAVMVLADAGRVDIDKPVRDVLPEFRVADEAVARTVSPRQLLTHTSGIAGDVLVDCGCGDDAVGRMVAALADIGQDVPVGSTFSYSNSGFAVLGRMLERATGSVWDEALSELVLEPLGLTHTVSRAEQLTRFRATCGHGAGPAPVELEPVSPLYRGTSPAGSTMYASATEVVAFGRMFLDGGVARDGGRVLSAESVDAMLRPQVARPVKGQHCGLAWMLHDWDGRRVIEHGGGTFGHLSYFEMVPDRGVAIALLTNGRNQFADVLYRELFRELCDLERPTPAEAPSAAAGLPDVDGVTGRYERFGVRVDVELRDGALHAIERLTEPLASLIPWHEPVDYEVRPSAPDEGLFLARETPDDPWEPIVFQEIDGKRYLNMAERSQPRVG